MQVLMNGMLTNGVTVLTMARFDMEQALELVAEHKVTRFFAVPPMVLGLAKAPIVDQYDLSSVKQVSPVLRRSPSSCRTSAPSASTVRLSRASA